jgi:putative transposase
LPGIELAFDCTGAGALGVDLQTQDSNEVRELIHRLAQENHGWGAPKIHGELMKLGFNISEGSVSPYLRRMHRHEDRAKSWLTFLRNHREMIVAFDLFTVPTLMFQQLTVSS